MRVSQSVKKHRREKLALDNYTFGDSKAEVTLAKLLTERNNPGLSKKITKALTSYSAHLKNIKLLDETIGTRQYLFDLLKRDAVKQVDEGWIAKQDPEVTTYFKNCLMKRLRKFIRKEYVEKVTL